MKNFLLFEWKAYFKKPGIYFFLLSVILLGLFTGSNFSLSISPDVFKNSSYTTAYMIGLLSLLCILFSTVLVTQILFKETDANFNLILYAAPVRKQDYLLGRFIAVGSISFLCFGVFVTGFAFGQLMMAGKGNYTDFSLSFYMQPLLVFGLVNTFFCTAVLCSVGWLSKSKLMVYVSGLFIYILYMVALIFSGSPLMAQGMPQSAATVQLSASLDPFGLSAYIMQTSTWSVPQRNTGSIPLSGTLLFNRFGVTVAALLSLFVTFKTFTFSAGEKKYKKIPVNPKGGKTADTTARTLKPIQPANNFYHLWASLFSFSKLDLQYITKSIPFVLACISLLFYLSMEIYAAIEKGIRLPQKYASSGLMAKTIIENFHGLCLMVVLYYANEIVWRSRNSNFHLIENVTPAGSTVLFFSKWLTLGTIIFFFTTLVILLGIVFQMQYNYFNIDWRAYAGIYVFTCFPLIVSSGIILVIHKLTNLRHLGLIVSAIVILFSATSLGNKLLPYPLLMFQIPYKGLYSDMTGFGPYLAAFGWQHLFGLGVVIIFTILVTRPKRPGMKSLPQSGLVAMLVCCSWTAIRTMKDYRPINTTTRIREQAMYEKNYRCFQNLPQPTVTDVTTTIDLFPEKNAYEVAATYSFQNKSNKPIDSILVNFADDILIEKASIVHKENLYAVKNKHTVIRLQKPLLPGDTAQFSARFSYHWSAINGHQSFNAILQNGSFMRISRVYPTFGYSPDIEIGNESERKRFNLGAATPIISVETPKQSISDFINLDMTISTISAQTAIGIGELVKRWQHGNRSYFQYKTNSPIPFRFAVSSAKYKLKTVAFKGKNIEVYFHPTHFENVGHLIKNIERTMDYCETNFGPYPFKTIRFAEVSAFTKGFAATAYPATIYMTENMVFNANLGVDRKQDVINELAGHELSHLWWGNSQISPEEREGNVMLTETLAMYTELMLVKGMYGKERMLENVRLHLGMYLDERGYTEEQPLFKALPANTHLSYSKSLVVMYQLSEMIGEEKLNHALRNFLQQHAYPHAKPVSTDFINQLYAVTDSLSHPKIDDLFKKITLYDFAVKNTIVKEVNTKYELSINGAANKYYEDGNGKQVKASFNDTVAIAILFRSGKKVILTMPIIKNQLAGKVLLDEPPTMLLVDPDIKFIKKGEAETIEIGN